MNHSSAARRLVLALTAAGLVLLGVSPAYATPRCFGKPATITGTAGRDHLEGTAGADVIVGLDGEDTILGRGGDDRTCGGRGPDWMSGERGHDRIAGGKRYDILFGSAGNDLLLGGPGGNLLSGRHGDDVLVGGEGADSFYPKGGNDIVIGEAGDDDVTVGGGLDQYDGGDGVDRIYFYNFSDPLTVDLAAGLATGNGFSHLIPGFENVAGGGGADTLVGNEADNWFLPLGGDDWIDGQGGRDEVSYSWITYLSPEGVTVDLASGTAISPHGSDTLVRVEDITGSETGDVLRGDDGPNRLNGYSGEDTFEGRGGDDILDGGYIDENYDLDVADGGTHSTGDTCVGIEQATNCEFSELPARPVSRRS